MHGRHQFDQRTSAGLRQAIKYFEQALALDPHYARAYASLADAYNQAIWHIPLAPPAALRKARAAALRAIALDETLADAHQTLGTMYRSNWDWAAEERAYEQALRLGANSARVHHGAAYYFAIRGRLEEALREMYRARELDPLNLAVNADVAQILYYARRYDEAIAQARQTLALDSRFGNAHAQLAMTALQKGDYQTASYHAQQSTPRGGQGDFMLACAYAAAGQRSLARQLLDSLRRSATQERFLPLSFAQGYACLGDQERALAWLEQAYEQHDTSLVGLKIAPLLDPLRADPRFTNLLRRVGLP